MGLLSMNNDEHILHEKYIAESARLLGYIAQLYQIKESTSDIYYDSEVEYEDPVQVNILFDDNPKPKLKSLGWLLETDANPYLAIITNYRDDNENPYDIPNRVVIQKNCKIVLESFTTVDTSKYPREFQITEVQGNSINPLYWTCKLVPWRDQYDFKPSTPEVDKTLDGNPNKTTGQSYINKKI